MTPFYQDDLVTLYRARWQDVPAHLLRADVVVTDPPYGISWSQRAGLINPTVRRKDGIAGDEDTSARDEFLATVAHLPAAVFGSFRAPAPAGVRQVLIHHKSRDRGLIGSVTGFRTDAEPIYLVGPWPKRAAKWSSVIRAAGGMNGIVAGVAQGSRQGHPHRKPLDVMVRLLMGCPEGVVLDPFAGGGATLMAARMLGRRAIGVECDERWCRLAVLLLRRKVAS